MAKREGMARVKEREKKMRRSAHVIRGMIEEIESSEVEGVLRLEASLCGGCLSETALRVM